LASPLDANPAACAARQPAHAASRDPHQIQDAILIGQPLPPLFLIGAKLRVAGKFL